MSKTSSEPQAATVGDEERAAELIFDTLDDAGRIAYAEGSDESVRTNDIALIASILRGNGLRGEWRPIESWYEHGPGQYYGVLVACVDGVNTPVVGEAQHHDEDGWYWAGSSPSDGRP